MKKETDKKDKGIFLLAGILASIVIIVLLLAFIKLPVSGKVIFENSKTNSRESNSNQAMNLMSGNGNAYACLNSEGKIFRSETPCK